jgi:hypothetical protein
MKTRPVIMSAESVRAIQDGRKTQTRRVVKRLIGIGNVTEFQRSTTGGYDWSFRDKRMLWNDLRHDELLERCPYGVVGDRLWVRETWAAHPLDNCDPPERVLLRADGANYDIDGRGPIDLDFPAWQPDRWRSPLFMPRDYSRITLEITDARMERVQDISEDDARKEGLCFDVLGWYVPGVPATGARTAGKAFAQFWDFINARRGYPWESNPWTWALTFKRVQS